MLKPGILLFFLFEFTALFCFGDSIPDESIMELALLNKGYENIVVLHRSDTIFVGAENRLYRWDPKAYSHILSVIMPLADQNSTICLAVLQKGIPMVLITLSKRAWEDALNGILSKKDISASMNTTMNFTKGFRKIFRCKGENPTYNKIDLVIYPQVKIQLGNFDDPFESQFNIAPAFEISFMRGMNLMAQIIIPLQNDLETNGNNVRPGIISISQTIRFPRNFFGIISAGYFTRNRYGFNSEIRKFFFNGKISVGFSGGLTGYAELIDRQWNYTGINLFTWFADAGYRWAKYDLTMKAGYGSFLNGEGGWRFDAFRQFREVTVGFFASETGGFLNGGFYFRVPLPPRKYSTKHFIRIRPESYFSWEYRARGRSEAGRSFSSGSSIPDLFYNLNPDYLKTNILDELYLQIQTTEKK
jgi:hypothetical protein